MGDYDEAPLLYPVDQSLIVERRVERARYYIFSRGRNLIVSSMLRHQAAQQLNFVTSFLNDSAAILNASAMVGYTNTVRTTSPTVILF